MDGSQKLPQRMLESIRLHRQRDTAWPLLALGVAGWMRYVSGVDDAGHAIDVRDPLSDKIRAIVETSGEEERVTALLALTEIFRYRPAAGSAVCRGHHPGLPAH
ncbi:D-mannonate oxidoreductase [Leclercia adecarboxylata]|uniref:D-mannonate oxidoreductase n=1 Tax=Leclercia adecarboxylata TaxID=83655 RepID=A0A4U9I7Q8_9ENTR|nr:D-mannonate oxidoreductase [Leclercia adecarboxylata]